MIDLFKKKTLQLWKHKKIVSIHKNLFLHKSKTTKWKNDFKYLMMTFFKS